MWSSAKSTLIPYPSLLICGLHHILAPCSIRAQRDGSLDLRALTRRGAEPQRGELSQYTSLDCTGPLYEIRDGKLLRYRCRLAHAYTADGVLDEKAEALESALYVALNTLEESAEMSRTLAARGHEHRQGHAAARFEARARKAGEHVDLIRTR